MQDVSEISVATEKTWSFKPFAAARRVAASCQRMYQDEYGKRQQIRELSARRAEQRTRKKGSEAATAPSVREVFRIETLRTYLEFELGLPDFVAAYRSAQSSSTRYHVKSIEGAESVEESSCLSMRQNAVIGRK